MAGIPRELSISLEHLDDHLRAILKLKLREFVHLSPWFHNIPSIDTTYYPKARPSASSIARPEDSCPNRDRPVMRKRYVRPAVK
jgi:hypothetical protein